MKWAIVTVLFLYAFEGISANSERGMFRIEIANCNQSSFIIDHNSIPTVSGLNRDLSYAVGFKLKNHAEIITVAEIFDQCKKYDTLINTSYELADINVYDGNGRKMDVSYIELNRSSNLASIFLSNKSEHQYLKHGFIPEFKSKLMAFDFGATKGLHFSVGDTDPKPAYLDFIAFKKEYPPTKDLYFDVKTDASSISLGSPIIRVVKNRKGVLVPTDTILGMIHSVQTVKSGKSAYLFGLPLEAREFWTDIQADSLFHARAISDIQLVSNAPIRDEVKSKMPFKRRHVKALTYIRKKSLEWDLQRLYQKSYSSSIISTIYSDGSATQSDIKKGTRRGQWYSNNVKNYPFVFRFITMYGKQYAKENAPSNVFNLDFFENLTPDSLTTKEMKWMVKAGFTKDLLRKYLEELYQYIDARQNYAKAREFVAEENCKDAFEMFNKLKLSKYGTKREVQNLLTKAKNKCTYLLDECLADILAKGLDPCDSLTLKAYDKCFIYSFNTEDEKKIQDAMEVVNEAVCPGDCQTQQDEIVRSFYRSFEYHRRRLSQEYEVDLSKLEPVIEIKQVNDEDCHDIDVSIDVKVSGKFYGKIDNFVNGLKFRGKRFSYALGEYDDIESKLSAYLIQSAILSFEESVRDLSTERIVVRLVGAADATPFHGEFQYNGLYGPLEVADYKTLRKAEKGSRPAYIDLIAPEEIEKLERAPGLSEIKYPAFTKSDYENYRLANARAMAFKTFLSHADSRILHTDNIKTEGIIYKESYGKKYRYVDIDLRLVSKNRKVEQGPIWPEGKPRYHGIFIAAQDYKGRDQGGPNGLKQPIAEVTSVAKVLKKKYGFTADFIIDPDHTKLNNVLDSLKHLPDSVTNVLLYYTGHGEVDTIDAQVKGFWLPVDAPAKYDPNTWVSNATVREALHAMENKHVALISDICYAGTIFSRSPMYDDSPLTEDEVNRRRELYGSRQALTSTSFFRVPDGGLDEGAFAGILIGCLQQNRRGLLSLEALSGCLKSKIKRNARLEKTYDVQLQPLISDTQHTGHFGGEFVLRKTRK